MLLAVAAGVEAVLVAQSWLHWCRPAPNLARNGRRVTGSVLAGKVAARFAVARARGWKAGIAESSVAASTRRARIAHRTSSVSMSPAFRYPPDSCCTNSLSSGFHSARNVGAWNNAISWNAGVTVVAAGAAGEGEGEGDRARLLFDLPLEAFEEAGAAGVAGAFGPDPRCAFSAAL